MFPLLLAEARNLLRLIGQKIKRGDTRAKARFKRRISHVPNLMVMSKIYCSCSLALDSAHVKFDV